MANLIDTIVNGPIIHGEGTATKNGDSGLRIDYSTGTTFEINMDAYTNNIDSINVINIAGGTYYKTFLLQVTQHNRVPVQNIEWSAGAMNHIKWPAGTGPTLTTTNDKKDIYSFSSWDDGTTWYGKVIGQNYS